MTDRSLDGSFTGTGVSPTFLSSYSFTLRIDGNFVGTVQLERSTDGATWAVHTVNGSPVSFTAAGSAAIVSDGINVYYRLNCTQWTRGQIIYDLQHMDKMIGQALQLATRSAVADPRRSAPSGVLRHCTNRVGVPNTKSGSSTRSGWRVWQSSYVPVSAIQVAIPNWYVGSATSGVETGMGSTMTCALSIEYPRGTFTRLTWNGGQTSGTIADGTTGWTDVVALPFTIPAFARFRICGDIQMAGGGFVPSLGWANIMDRGGGDEYQAGTTADYTMQSTGINTSGSANGFMPACVRTYSDRPVWGLVGDSLIAGVNDQVPCPSGGRGLFGRALARVTPHMNMGVPGDQAQLAAANYTRRLALLVAGGVDRVALELGVKDFNAGSRTSAQVLADRTTLRTMLTGAGMRVYDTTVTVQTTSTDTFKTAVNQTLTNTTKNTERTTFNTALRTSLQTSSSGLIDVAANLETATTSELGPVTDGGAWMPAYMNTNGDGTHPISTGYAAASDVFARLLDVMA